jgi:hypothetical protein
MRELGGGQDIAHAGALTFALATIIAQRAKVEGTLCFC